MREREQDNSEAAPPSEELEHGDLRGSFVAVVMMALFFVAAWFTVFAIAMVRR